MTPLVRKLLTLPPQTVFHWMTLLGKRHPGNKLPPLRHNTHHSTQQEQPSPQQLLIPLIPPRILQLHTILHPAALSLLHGTLIACSAVPCRMIRQDKSPGGRPRASGKSYKETRSPDPSFFVFLSAEINLDFSHQHFVFTLDSVETPPASPAPVEEPYESTAGSRPIPIPHANLSRSFEDLPLTPLTGRFDHQYLAERPKHQQSLSGQDKSSRKKKPRPSSLSVSTSTSNRSRPTKRMPMSGPSLAMSHQSGQVSPKPSPKDAPLYLNNLPRFHPAVYQSPNSTPNASLSPNTSNHHPRSFGYRVASGGSGSSREALRQYRELVAASVSLSRNNSDSSDAEISAPRLDPLGSPGPVTPLALEEAESYLSARNDYSSPRQADERERHGTTRTKDTKGR
ncbi:conserved hypothetical protein [Talaromyces stipitatus ATCC 10500]|uniref:Uncharacterized protein n=1 Tax=Talaromyces stipitatus (strain ATCC 10500 / CBS 375.48 / QM 6759 / NRRL 1006) TaxID=441959 RepID=B8M5B6_TALSN|nr:uncharacterized protein TSTA_029930 [Talaromyces stipitatus ATCC 10500]EED19722.1 conserved hypothetical protein [Talaromyces stipitatus ATCC 10500]